MGAVGTPQCGFFLSMFSSHVTDSAYELSAFQCSPFLSNPVHFSPLLSVFSVPLCSYPFLLSPLHTSSLLSTPLHSGPFLSTPLHSFSRRATRATDFGLRDGPSDGPNSRPRTHIGCPHHCPRRAPALPRAPLGAAPTSAASQGRRPVARSAVEPLAMLESLQPPGQSGAGFRTH